MTDKKLQQWSVTDKVPIELFDEAEQWQSYLAAKELPFTPWWSLVTDTELGYQNGTVGVVENE